MEKYRTSAFLLATYWTGWRRWVAWFICICFVILIGALRTETDAELAFASLVLLTPYGPNSEEAEAFKKLVA
jgi:hypothetical protein